MTPREQFAANLHRFRTERGMTQEALGYACDLHPTEVSRLEGAKRDPRLATVVRLARALDLPPGRLLDDIL